MPDVVSRDLAFWRMAAKSWDSGTPWVTEVVGADPVDWASMVAGESRRQIAKVAGNCWMSLMRFIGCSYCTSRMAERG